MKTKKTYVVTGATSGIGYETVKEFSVENVVFAGYRNPNLLEKLTSLGNNVVPFFIDMNDDNSIIEAGKFIASKTQHVDTLLNIAGCVVAGAMETLDVSKLRMQFNVNTFSHIEFTQQLLKANLLENSRIINISSMASFAVFPYVAPYCASKRALDILFNIMQVEYGDKIKVISVKPGVIATPLWDKSVEGNQDTLLNDNKYEKAYNYLKDNAHSNGKNGLNVKEVIKVLKKADSAKCPKTSYLVGKDAFVASVFSKLPQALINKVLQIGIKLKIYNN